uniref:EF-hand domain-containing protein n=1 Tax=Syphacia muris TaxID=451379 RepID=A0A0N5AQ03_9BILA
MTYAAGHKKARDIYGADSAQMTFAKSSLAVLWEGLRKTADTNHDDIISQNEWIELLHHTDTEHLPKWLQDYCGYMFKLFDVSADGVIDIAEYTDGMCSYGYKTDTAKQAFKHIAKDKKGERIEKIGPDDWNKLFHDYFFSKDKNALGNHLFGTINY